jgi:hypothetical protein
MGALTPAFSSARDKVLRGLLVEISNCNDDEPPLLRFAFAL